ncbi:transcription initiation factor TFIID subunit 8 [Abrus precatorius]|uniref:Transcription initiation factor TFIID subunit 8 n=1 Tax=Abrus precatorius TaxID=3816 RepID=A0A8B8MCH2_ABRPR|nr:transcription initiation factor TFIID subunit 8 [Abrus precatorius]
MSHGGERAASDDFGRAVAKLAVAQVCEAAGFHGARDSALEALADVAIRYLVDLGKTSEFYANLSGRSQCSVFDVIRGFEDLESPRGFLLRDVMNFVESVDEVPFANPIPSFPVIRERRNIPSFVQMGETPPSKHIPAWLPALPDAHTYIHTPVWDERVSDPREDKIEQARQRRKAERSLLSLQKRLLLRNGSVEAATPSTSLDPEEGVAKENNKNNNLVLPRNKEDSSVKVSVLDEGGVDGNRVSVLDAFAPAIEVLGSRGFCGGDDDDDDGLEGKKSDVPAVRPTVHFKFRTGKKFIGESLDTRLQKKDASRTASLAGREDERDDKKRRAEYILKQSIENPQELTLL